MKRGRDWSWSLRLLGSAALSLPTCRFPCLPAYPLAGRRRPLLGDTVERAESPDKIRTVNADDFATGKQSLERAACLLISGGVVRRQQDQIIRDVGVGVA